MATKSQRSPKGPDKLSVEWVPLDSLTDPKGRNPRTISDQQLRAICDSICEFGLVDPFVVRRSDRRIIGGNQRRRAIVRLLAGEHKRKNPETGKLEPVKFELPGGVVPVVMLDLDDRRADMLTIALNKIGGDWDYSSLGDMLRELTDDGAMLDLPIGFSPAELTDLLDIHGEISNDPYIGDVRTQRAPSISLEFSSVELRDAVKAAIGKASSGKKAMSGDVLARLLSIKKPRASK